MKLRWQMLAVAAVVVCLGRGWADEKDLPKAAELMDNFVKVTGGEAAHRKIKTRVAEGTMMIAGMEAPLKIYQKAPSSLYMEAELKNFGTIQMGTDGKVAWEINPVTGAKIKSGEAKERAIREANFYSDVEWRKIYKTVKTVGEEKVNDAPCWKVELTTPEGKTTTKYFDKKSGYVIKISATIDEPNLGKIETDNFIGDYKKVGGLIYPHTVKAVAAGQNLTITLTKVQHDVEIAADRFALPEAVRKLLDKDKEK